MKKIVYCLVALVAMATASCDRNGGNDPKAPDNGVTTQIPTDALKGVFTVSKDGRKACFSPGFLQFNTSNGVFQFAKAQWEIVGTANMKDKELGAVIDLFAWSGSDTKSFGISLKNDPMFYAGKFIDWGENVIGKNKPGSWRTMTQEEWTFLVKNHICQWAKVNGVEGLIILPDKVNESLADDYSLEDWKKIEDLWNAVFVPANFFRIGYHVDSPDGIRMWTSDPMTQNAQTKELEATMFVAASADSYGWKNCSLPTAMSVRLVTDYVDHPN